jgi:D-aminoacyl-tRNA deacylase
MRVFIQRVSEASVTINQEIHGKITKGFCILLGIEEADTNEDIEWLCAKIIGLRIFSDAEGKMNSSIKEVNGEILLISQFTLHAATKKGNRPSFIKAAKPEIAIPLYESFKQQLALQLGKAIATGQFGADMQVALVNDGPVSIWIDSKNRE